MPRRSQGRRDRLPIIRFRFHRNASYFSKPVLQGSISMGVQKELTKIKNELIVIETLLAKPDVAAASKRLDGVQKMIAATVKLNEEKKKKNEESIGKFRAGLANVESILDKNPFEGSKVIAAISTATAAANAAEKAVNPAG
jgi:hypothetical protein